MESGRLVVVGRIQEQHPERCRLFMQWQQMDWPVMIDPLNLLELESVPIVTAIDEHGVAHQVTQENFRAEFMERDFAPPAELPRLLAPHTPDLDSWGAVSASYDAASFAEHGAALFLWGGIESIDDAVEAFRRAVVLDRDDGRWHFRLGVCLRRRFESEHRQRGDFQIAVSQWSRALQLDPNQYVWRRRIQQYGPRLEKPYPFYDWVEQARSEIAVRGQVPVSLAVEPAGAELAQPTDNLASAEPQTPDPTWWIRRDDERFIRVETATVPPVVTPGSASRVYVILQPNQHKTAHWNNEADDLQLWVKDRPGWTLDSNLHTVPNPAELVSDETRRLDFEIQCGEDVSPGEVLLPAYALYYVCEDEACLYRRQDVKISLRVGQ